MRPLETRPLERLQTRLAVTGHGVLFGNGTVRIKPQQKEMSFRCDQTDTLFLTESDWSNG